MSTSTPHSVEALVEVWRTSETEASRAAEVRVAQERIREVCRDMFGGRDDEGARPPRRDMEADR